MAPVELLAHTTIWISDPQDPADRMWDGISSRRLNFVPSPLPFALTLAAGAS